MLVCACLCLLKQNGTNLLLLSSDNPSGLFPFVARATEINRSLTMEVKGIHHDGLMCSVNPQSQSIILAFLTVFNRNFPHLTALLAATESYLWAWISRYLSTPSPVIPQIRLLSKQTEKSSFPQK